jgi:hypothetical protein
MDAKLQIEQAGVIVFQTRPHTSLGMMVLPRASAAGRLFLLATRTSFPQLVKNGQQITSKLPVN